jgi:hypothetical protein
VDVVNSWLVLEVATDLGEVVLAEAAPEGLTGQTVVYNEMISVVREPSLPGQCVTVVGLPLSHLHFSRLLVELIPQSLFLGVPEPTIGGAFSLACS